MERVVELDPRNLGNLAWLTEIYHYQRRYADEVRTYDRALTIAPGDPDILLDRAKVALDWRADIKPYQSMQGTLIAEKIRATGTMADPAPQLHPLPTKCRRRQSNPKELSARGRYSGIVTFPDSYWEGVVARWQGDSGMAQTAFTAARRRWKRRWTSGPIFLTLSAFWV